MSQFNKYSNFYDIFYKDKDYKLEVNFLEQVFKSFFKHKVKKILSLGCGTASHDLILVQKGYAVTGVDLAKNMLKIAREKAKKIGVKMDLILGDVRNIRLARKFDTVIAMFNIAGYQNSNKDFANFLRTANIHLKKEGILVFDAWYLPAVLTDRPFNRTKLVNLPNSMKLSRKTSQRLDSENSILRIEFEVSETKNKKVLNKFKEIHSMRFFTLNEIKYFLENNGFELVKTCQPWNLKNKISDNKWNMVIIAKKI